MSMHVISWEDYVSTGNEEPHCSFSHSLSLAIGVFDGVHLGHQALIRCICRDLSKLLLPTVVTFRQNPARILGGNTKNGKCPQASFDILNLDQKLGAFEALGVKLTVLIDFSIKFSKMNGRDFIDLLLSRRPVQLIALGRDFHCGYGMDTGVREIQLLARERNVETCVVEPVMDQGLPISSSRIREALAAGRITEAERLLGPAITLKKK
jgi:riboflavin kinase/FMN adenylyltransferase